MLHDLLRDARHGFRLLLRSPVFAVVAVLSLGIGIGSNAAMFTVIDALLLKKLPVPQPDGLVYIHPIDEDQVRGDNVPYSNFERVRDASPQFTSLAGVWPIERSNLNVDQPDGDGASSALTRIALTTGDYFSTLGVTARDRARVERRRRRTPRGRRQRRLLAAADGQRSRGDAAHAASQRRDL